MRQDRGDYNFPFSLIRLRVRREPAFYLFNGVLPLFLVIVWCVHTLRRYDCMILHTRTAPSRRL